MCVILVKEVGYDLPNENNLLACWNKNPHGAGFMFNDNGKVIIKKGYMNFNDFYNELISIDKKIYLKNRGLVIHFRIATSGLVDKGNCHPHPLSDSINDLSNTYIETNLGVAHNGVITFYNRKDDTLNDTQLFVKNDLFELYSLDKKFYLNPIFQSMIERLINGSRFVFLNGQGQIFKIGKWYRKDNYYFSNLSHEKNEIEIDHLHLRKSKLFDNEMKYFIKENEEKCNEFFINDEVVEEEFYQAFVDSLIKLEPGESVYSDDFFEEYNGLNGEFYLDKNEKVLYEMIGSNEIMFINNYRTKNESYGVL